MPRSIIAAFVAASLIVLAVSPVAESAGSLAHRTAQALRLAKRADHNARIALARTAPAGPQGPAGANGADGTPGTSGHDGVPGHDGAPGVAGAKGADGVDGASIVGPTGPAGRDAPPRPAPVSAVNQSVVAFDPVARTPAVTAHTTVTATTGAVLLADVELRASASGDVTCALRMDGSTLDERAQSVTVGQIDTLDFHTEHDLGPGDYTFDVACTGPARVGALGARLTVIGG